MFHFPLPALPPNWQRSGALDAELGVFVPGGLGPGPPAARMLNPG